MQPRIEQPCLRAARWLAFSLVALAWLMASLASAGTPAPAAASYRIVPLWPGPAGSPGINARDQVAFTVAGPDGATARAKFYDSRRVRDIGTLGGADSFALAVNDLGQVAGYAMLNAANDFHAYLWRPARGIADLGAFGPGPGESLAYDLNNKGQAVGYAVRNGQGRPVLWSRQTGLLDLGTLPGATGGEAVAINDAGQVAGNSGQAFVWQRDTGLVGLGAGTQASVINARGQVGGTAINADGFPVSWVWTPGVGGVTIGAGGFNSQVRALNDRGMAIGNDTATGADAGYVWTRATGIRYFRVLNGGRNAAPFALNNRNQVVGSVDTADGAPAAFVWTFGGGLVDLNTRVPHAPAGLRLLAARAISDTGAIVADSTTGLVLLLPRAMGHAAPVAGPIAATGTAAANRLLSFSAAFHDADADDTHSASWDWGDGNREAGIVSAKHGAGSVSGQHAYRKAGTYTVQLAIVDSTGRRSVVQRRLAIGSAAKAIGGKNHQVLPPDSADLAAPSSAGPATAAGVGDDGLLPRVNFRVRDGLIQMPSPGRITAGNGGHDGQDTERRPQRQHESEQSHLPGQSG